MLLNAIYERSNKQQQYSTMYRALKGHKNTLVVSGQQPELLNIKSYGENPQVFPPYFSMMYIWLTIKHPVCA